MKKIIFLLLFVLAMPYSFAGENDPRCYATERNEPLEALNMQIAAVARITATVNSEEDGGPEMATFLELLVDSIKNIYTLCPTFKDEVVDLQIIYRTAPDSTEVKEEMKHDRTQSLVDFVKVMNTQKGSFAYELLDSVK